MGMPAHYEPLTRIGHEPDAFEAFYRDHVDDVQRFVARRVDDPHLAADLTADVFLAAIDGAHTYLPTRGPVIAWLYGVGRNTIAAEVRRRSRELHAVRRISGHRLLDPASLARIEERIDAERESRRLYRALAELSDDDRTLLELVALDGLSVADAARSLGVKPATARVRLHRSRARLTAILRRTGARPGARSAHSQRRSPREHPTHRSTDLEHFEPPADELRAHVATRPEVATPPPPSRRPHRRGRWAAGTRRRRGRRDGVRRRLAGRSRRQPGVRRRPAGGR